MIVMPSCDNGWGMHSLARETGRLGHLISPKNERGPWPWFPYAMDNGCFSLWDAKENTFDGREWLRTGEDQWHRMIFWAQANEQKPLWAIVPDRPGHWAETVRKWSVYSRFLVEAHIPLAIAVQDGATVEDVRALSPVPHVIAVGGSTEWKWKTAETWLRAFERVHLLRCNAPEKLYWLEQMGCMSCDGTGWNRGDRKQTRGLEEWARSKAVPVSMPVWPHMSRAKRDKKQETFA